MDFFKKLAGFGALGLVPMMIAKALEKKDETNSTSATPATTTPPMFDGSQFSANTLPPISLFGVSTPMVPSNAPTFSPTELALLRSIKDPAVRARKEEELANDGNVPGPSKYSPTEMAMLASIHDPKVRSDLELKLSTVTDPAQRAAILQPYSG